MRRDNFPGDGETEACAAGDVVARAAVAASAVSTAVDTAGRRLGMFLTGPPLSEAMAQRNDERSHSQGKWARQDEVPAP